MKAFSFLFFHSQLLETVQKTYEIDKEQLQKKLATATEELTKSRTATGKFFNISTEFDNKKKTY